MRRFALVLSLLALVAVFATPAFADQAAAPAAPDTDAVTQPAEQAPAAPQVDDENVEDFLKSLEGTAGAENKYICPGDMKCTHDLECERYYGFQLNCQNGTQPVCDNPTGYSCAGTCICC